MVPKKIHIRNLKKCYSILKKYCLENGNSLLLQGKQSLALKEEKIPLFTKKTSRFQDFYKDVSKKEYHLGLKKAYLTFCLYSNLKTLKIKKKGKFFIKAP